MKKFQRLTPRNDVDIHHYEEALNFAIDSEGILNIALSGNYGSGKSSIIETFKDKCKGKNGNDVLHISLSKFSRMHNDRKSGSDGEKNVAHYNYDSEERMLEGKIINQLLHQIASQHIPLTIFKSKENASSKTIFGWFMNFVFIFLPIVFIWKYDDMTTTIRHVYPAVHGGSVLKIIAVIILISALVYLLYKLVYLQMNNKLFKSISFKSGSISGEIEVMKDSNVSYFDKYLDDVIYLFDNCQSNIIVFEDIDRFETNIIFEKLREINTLVNNKRKARIKNRTNIQKVVKFFQKLFKSNGYLVDEDLKFIYLIRDDMFTTKERTKFFDFIIPVIPVITTENSRDMFNEILSEMGYQNDFPGVFLRKISIYIDDMRLLKNICNEYSMYRNILISSDNQDDKLNLSKEKMLAMIIFKNIFPKDFSDLQLCAGFLYRLLEDERRLIDEKVKDLDSKISILNNSISDAEKEIINNEAELYTTILKKSSKHAFLKVNNIVEDEFPNYTELVKEILKSNSEILSFDSYSNVRYSDYGRKVEMKDLFPDMSSDEFRKRLSNIKNRDKINELIKQKQLLEQEQKEIQHQKIDSLITRSHFDKTLENKNFKHIQSNPVASMIYFFLENGYIDKTYKNYLTYFYPGSLNKEDKEFIIDVQGGKINKSDYKLENIPEIYSLLEGKDFEKDTILNFYLFRYILEHKKVSIIKKYLSTERIGFVVDYFAYSDYSKQVDLISEIFSLGSEFAKCFLSSSLPDNTKADIIQRLIFECDISKMKLAGDVSEQVSNFISDNWRNIWQSFNRLEHTAEYKTETIKNNLEFLKIKFHHFDFCDEYGDLNNFVYQGNKYALNGTNIASAIIYFAEDINKDEVYSKNLSLIYSREELKHLRNYAQHNIEEYLSVILSFTDNIIDEEAIIYSTLNDDRLSDNITLDYLNRLKENTLNVSQIENESILDEAMRLNKIKFNTENVLEYFNQHDSWNDVLINFVNSKDILKIDKKVFTSRNQDFQKNFFTETVESIQLDEIHYKSILSNLGRTLNRFPKNSVSIDKIKILIDTKVISSEFQVSILEGLRERYSDAVIDYLQKYFSGYIAKIEEPEVYAEDELLALLKVTQKIKDARAIIDNFNGVISVVDNKYEPRVSAYILEHKFDIGDLGYIVKNYSKFEKIEQNVIEKIAKEFITKLITEKYRIDKSLVIKIISSNDLDLDDRRLLFGQNIEIFSEEEAVRYLDLINLSDDYREIFEKLAEGRQATISSTPYNTNILNFLKGKKISSFLSDKRDSNFYRIYGFKK